jgi:hypothetical protein
MPTLDRRQWRETHDAPSGFSVRAFAAFRVIGEMPDMFATLRRSREVMTQVQDYDGIDRTLAT